MRIKENISRPEIGGFKEVKFRGDVKLKLLDPETKEVVKEVKGHNMQTDAISLIMSTNYYGMLDYESLRPIAKVLCGGILAFRQPLTESANNIYPPMSADNTLVAHAGQTTYSSAAADPKRGLPNDDPALTGPIANGYKLVWDFPASQGNGTITSLALTHADTGDYWLYGGADYSPLFYKQAPASTGNFTPLPQLFNSSRREAYRLTSSGTDLTVTTISDYGMIKNMGIAQRPLSQNETSSVLVSDHIYTMPQNCGKMRYLYFEDDNELHCLYFYTDGDSGKISKVVINLSSNSSTTETITINKKLRTPNDLGNNSFSIYTLDVNGFLYLVGDGNKIVVIRYLNISSDTTREISVSSSVPTEACDYSLGLGYMGYLPYAGLLIDGNTARDAGSPFPTGLGRGVFYRYNKPISLVGWNPLYNFQSGYWMAYSINKLYMATIKNLEEPVLKSAAYAMQIEYTLTEVEENE